MITTGGTSATDDAEEKRKEKLESEELGSSGEIRVCAFLGFERFVVCDSLDATTY